MKKKYFIFAFSITTIATTLFADKTPFLPNKVSKESLSPKQNMPTQDSSEETEKKYSAFSGGVLFLKSNTGIKKNNKYSPGMQLKMSSPFLLKNWKTDLCFSHYGEEATRSLLDFKKKEKDWSTIPGLFPEKLQFHCKFHFNVWKGSVGRPLHFAKGFLLKPSIGLEAMKGSFFAKASYDKKKLLEMSQNFWGIGPQVGIQIQQKSFIKGLTLIGSIMESRLLHYNKLHSLKKKEVIPVTKIQSGVNWKMINSNFPSLEISARYEWQFWNGQFYNFITAKHEDFILHGFIVQTKLNF